MGYEWPDKRDKIGIDSVARCGLWGGLSNGTVLPMNFINLGLNGE